MSETVVAPLQPGRQPGLDINGPAADLHALALHVCHVKRFIERWAADDRFRQALRQDPQGAAREWHLTIDPEAIRPLWDLPTEATDWRHWDMGACETYPLAAAYLAFRRARVEAAEALRHISPASPAYRRWRARQVARCHSVFPRAFADALPHAPFACELSLGCSVGCWFCGVGADRLTAHAWYGSGQQWRDILAVLRDFTGPAAGARGLLYWASDPLDHPQFEHFARDFTHAFGAPPHTTTALATRDAERTRRLLPHATAESPLGVRFSVLSVAALDRIHAAFTAESLAHVELVPQTPGSVLRKVPVGKARLRLMSGSPPPTGRVPLNEGAPSIACVSGLLINLVSGRVRLITPAPCSDREPDGYRTIAQGQFSTAADLEQLVSQMVAEHMRVLPAEDLPLRAVDGLTVHERDDGFELASAHARHVVAGGPLTRQLGQWLAGGCTLAQLRQWVTSFGLPAEVADTWVIELFDSGCLA
ncbi:MAG: radical SAM family RiPP maturation amino acid epimerase [Vicinamibacterales bacterium]